MTTLSPAEYRIVFVKLDEALREMDRDQLAAVSEAANEVEKLMEIVSEVESPPQQLLTST